MMNSTQSALDMPRRSLLRKTSARTDITTQIQASIRNSQKIDQKMSKNPIVSSIFYSLVFFIQAGRMPAIFPDFVTDAVPHASLRFPHGLKAGFDRRRKRIPCRDQ